ncbi:dihydrofolate reductase family protein [Knoellia aerolata]|uniref:Deaminase n=1 Tax=Knoellia aerolata DSM 18566 TaxID=1385519 RepID=A0A0A0JZT7_9MICO|nr:dihydrofolate reductase family protein [Knoellia aerolata]KGN41016.1 deaminase [Knoellia aerolata DSM 18566]
MRLLLDTRSRQQPTGALADDDLARLYAWPDGGGVRANFVSTLDGSGVGGDGRSGSINTDADGRVFHLQRDLADCVLVGAGTARAEGYRRGPTPIVVVSRSGRLPESLATGAGDVLLVTCASSGRVEGPEVWVEGDDLVDLQAVVARLREAGMPCVLTEGGPRLFHDLLDADVVDELALTLAPRIVGGDHTRVVAGDSLGGTSGLDVELVHLVEEDGSVLGLWRLPRA